MIYLICGSYVEADRWFQSEKKGDLSKILVLPTADYDSIDRIRGREIRQGDAIERVGAYDQGPYWQEIEDTLKCIDPDGVLS